MAGRFCAAGEGGSDRIRSGVLGDWRRAVGGDVKFLNLVDKQCMHFLSVVGGY